MRRLVGPAILVVIIAACSGRGPQAVGGTQPSWRGTANGGAASGSGGNVALAKPVTFAPSGQPAARYNEPLQAPPRSALGDAVYAAVKEEAVKAGTQVPLADARLFRACAELSEIVPEEGIIAYSLVEFALQRNGIIEPSPHLLVVWGDIDSPEAIVKQLRPRLAEILVDGATARVGIGAAKRMNDGTGAIVFALQASGVTTSPVPRQVKAGGSFTLDAVVDARYRSPEVFITRDNGSTERLDLKLGTSNGFKTLVDCGKSIGKQQVEITASDQQGSTVLANFPVWCGAEPPLSLTVTPSYDDEPVSDPVEAEKRLLAMVNRDRATTGLHALLWDEKVADVSRGHSNEMRTTKVVAHISPKTGSAADRVRAAKIKTALVLENVARAYGLGEAHQGLMNSPGHRANLTSKTATHVGIGVVFGDEVSGRREIFITQVFTRVPPKVEPAKAAELVRAKLAAAQPVTSAPKLVVIAQEWADQLAAGKTREQTYAVMRRKVDTLGGSYLRVSSVITAASELDSIDGKSLLGETRVDDIGVGIAQGPHPEIGDGAIWIVVLLAQKR
ncbi:MAG: CAP domain-containing protein [Myxococcota bacterium]|nr:CAP domain-containing protein [Myxococcota bacterium]